MQYEISGEDISVKINSKGAELCSLIHNKTGTEHIWQADPYIWDRHAPILFPIVGLLNNNEYCVAGRNYNLPQHGFARDLEFELINQSDNNVKLCLSSNEESLEKYPFQFQLDVLYTLDGNKLKIEYIVKNTDDSEILFCIGAHPGFTAPFFENEKLDDYYLEFEKPETRDRLKLGSNGLLTGERIPDYLDNNKRIELSSILFNEGALIVEGFESEYIAIKSKNHERCLKFFSKGYPFYGIWSKPGAPFVCLEPWYGIADTEGRIVDFEMKNGIQKLQPSKTFSCSFGIEIR